MSQDSSAALAMTTRTIQYSIVVSRLQQNAKSVCRAFSTQSYTRAMKALLQSLTLRQKKLLIWSFGVVIVLFVAWFNWKSQLPDAPAPRPKNVFPVQHDADSRPSALSTWPWKNATKTFVRNGVSSWTITAPDGTLLQLTQFDFAANRNLKFAIFDQDEDAPKPWSNNVAYWPRGVAQMTRQLNGEKHGTVVACWNGLFFGYRDSSANPKGHAFHLSPVVIDGKVHSSNLNFRWTFGVEYSNTHANGAPTFKAVHLPSLKTLQTFDWAAGSAQCLILDGKPLRLQPFPKKGDLPIKQPVSSTPRDVGHIPIFDHMKTCRASIAWSRDSKKLWVLWVKEPDSEIGSAIAMRHGTPTLGGWTVPDLQRFWLSMKPQGVNSAINSDAGDVLQATLLRSDGNYDLIPPGWATRAYLKKTFAPDFPNAPRGGALMYFYVRDTSVK